ncbi:MAG: hypothetical protein ACI9FW_002162 [Flavobacterium sp.]|jgi:hypothetical protein
MERLAPICLFTYNRLEETKQTIVALQKNFLAKDSELFVFSDGAKNLEGQKKVEELRLYLQEIKGFKKILIVESRTNKGLANSIIEGVTKILEQFGKVIVLEDDLITTPNFLNFMNHALNYFEYDKSIYTVSGYSPWIKNLDKDTFYTHSRSFPWGWATWKEKWVEDFFDIEKIKKYISEKSNLLQDFNKNIGEDASEMLLKTLDGKISSWYIRWVFNNYLLERKAIYPVLSKVENIGNSKDATHFTGGISAYQCILDTKLETSFDFKNTIPLKNRDYRFLKYFSKKHKFIYRLKLLVSITGIKLLLQELKVKFLK